MALGLASLGKVAGIGGIATGAVVLLVRPLIEQVLPSLNAAAQAEAVQFIAIGAFALGGLGILTWATTSIVAGPLVRTHGNLSPGVIAGGNVSFGEYKAPKPRPAAQGAKDHPDRLPTTGRAVTRGDQSPSVIAGGDVAGL